MKRFNLLLAVPLLLAFGCQAGPDATSAEWWQLRAQRGHFEGGTWNKELDAWQGRKHQVMQRLADRLLEQRPREEGVRALMGEPDRVVPAGSAKHADWLRRTEWRGTPGGTLWSYHWRGNHDQLLVAFDAQRVAAVGWLYAWE